LSVIGQELTAA